jgi:hypothetical protein
MSGFDMATSSQLANVSGGDEVLICRLWFQAVYDTTDLQSSPSLALARCGRLRRESCSGHMGRQRYHMCDGFRPYRSWSSIRVRLASSKLKSLTLISCV